MHIGLIGGIGVAATIVYYQRLTAAVDRLGGKLELTISHGHLPTLIKYNLADERQPQAEIFAAQVASLKGAGCDCAAISSIGGHFCYDELAAISPLPLVSAIKPLDEYFAGEGIGTVGLLGTRAVMRTGFFGQLHKTRAVALDDEIDVVGQTYQDIAVSGTCTPEQRAFFLDAGARLVRERGADAVVLSGTDLNLAFDGTDPGYRVIDALDVHVDILARLATGRTSLADV